MTSTQSSGATGAGTSSTWPRPTNLGFRSGPASLGVSLEIGAPRRVDGVFGFGVNNTNFENGNFGRASDGQVRLDIEAARKLLKLRWFQITMRPTAPNINSALESVFGVGPTSWPIAMT